VQQNVRTEVQQQKQQQQQPGRQGVEDTQHTQTVGAVAIDSAGRLAAATSTGGRTCKVSAVQHRKARH
jgi:isoaspartyl peptidase/L-asparaginase-like protein (Ntn-hydrolase superfamily)